MLLLPACSAPKLTPFSCLCVSDAGVGGLPRGRIVEMYGPESSGKTTVALHVVAEAQKLGGRSIGP
jgi:recombination protein RecA